MPWKECDRVSQRRELTELALARTVSIAELARRFGVSRKTVYKWLGRRQSQSGDGALSDRSRRPQTCPHRTSAAMAERVLALRSAHPA